MIAVICECGNVDLIEPGTGTKGIRFVPFCQKCLATMEMSA
jgi:hypothetical protein